MNKCHIEQLYVQAAISDNVNRDLAMPHFKTSTRVLSYSLLPNLLEEV